MTYAIILEQLPPKTGEIPGVADTPSLLVLVMLALKVIKSFMPSKSPCCAATFGIFVKNSFSAMGFFLGCRDGGGNVAGHVFWASISD